jgi:hypothetical protein
LARIANSVYRHMCPGDPTCRSFGFSVSPSRCCAVMVRLLLHALTTCLLTLLHYPLRNYCTTRTGTRTAIRQDEQESIIQAP